MRATNSERGGRGRQLALLFAAASLVACLEDPSSPSASGESEQIAPTDVPYVLVLGTAQDGGLPQLGCQLECCRAARSDPSRARRVTSLLLVDPRSGSRWLFDASPDLAQQVESAANHPASFAPPSVTGGRGPLFDGIFPTHAHIGHYLGLAWLGREAYGVRGQVVYASERFEAFVSGNGPWSLSAETGAFEFRRIAPGAPVQLADDLAVEALRVPHRDEFSDTYAFIVRGPERDLLYLPDIDKWEAWDAWSERDGADARRIEEVLADVDVALVDGTFFGPDEIPGRAMSQIPHPFVVESLARFAVLPEPERAKIRFTHLNHTNPAADPASPEAQRVVRAGFRVAADGEILRL